jgi:putative aldouronate transport system permease protein
MNSIMELKPAVKYLGPNAPLKSVIRNKALYTMLLPGLILLIINNYVPMFGAVIAFKDYRYNGHGFISSLIDSKWIGFNNFKFFWNTPDAFAITRNTLAYNLFFIFLTLVCAVLVAIALNEIRSGKLAKFYQSAMFLPNFMSWVIVSYLVYAFLNADAGVLNRSILAPLGIDPIQWYGEAKYWPFILPIVHVWKNLGYNSIIYLAGITGLDSEYYEAAKIDGASRFQQVTKITIPLLTPLIITMTLLQIGRVFYADFGLFFQVTQNAGALYPTTLVIDTYVYNALKNMGDLGLSSAVGLYQSTIGFALVLISNLVVRKIEKERALF